MKERCWRVLKKYVIILGIGVAYLVFVMLTGWGIPCVFHAVTGLLCPACGVSRMLVSLARLDFAAAYAYNPFLLLTSPIILFCLLYGDVKYVLKGDRHMGKWVILAWAEIGGLLAFGVLRNIL